MERLSVTYSTRTPPRPLSLSLLPPRSGVTNSYYLADGVKLFSQETWRLFMGEAGREMVGKYAQDVTDYYCMASELDNHCVRESACHSIAEMAEKVRVGCWHGRTAVPLLSPLLCSSNR